MEGLPFVVVPYGGCVHEQYFFQALKADASGYVLKSVADRDLVAACRAAVRDEPLLYPGEVSAFIRNYLDRAEMLFISIKTVHRHRASLLQTLGLRDRLELTRYAVRATRSRPATTGTGTSNHRHTRGDGAWHAPRTPSPTRAGSPRRRSSPSCSPSSPPCSVRPPPARMPSRNPAKR